MSRLSEDDKYFGPFTYATTKWKAWRCMLNSGGGDSDNPTRNSLTIYLGGHIVRVWLPTILKPHRVRHELSPEYMQKLKTTKSFYFEDFDREYGFCYSEGSLHVHYGAQTHDSRTNKTKVWFLPWTEWRHVRYSVYDLEGKHFGTVLDKDDRQRGIRMYESQRKLDAEVPKVKFLLRDYDGVEITATTFVNERQWKRGTSWCSWLSLFWPDQICRSLNITFSGETGPEKGSWKGGTIGTSIEMLKGETHEDAMRRFCTQEHRSKNGKFKMEFVEVVNV